ncbi:MAG TPA: SDR family oxidoreductase [Bacteroidia bacterium]|nr:SDR family oxidoreductase [Bacteroidia bacterium]
MNILITGASSGIGFQVALQLSKDSSHRVFAVSRSSERLDTLKEEAAHLNAEAQLIPLVGDISKPADIARWKEEIMQYCTHIDFLVNNAGTLINKPFLQLEDKDWQEVYETNVFGIVKLVRMLYPLLERASEKSNSGIAAHNPVRAHIVNISSMGGVQGSVKFPGLSAYSSSKAAVINLTECLAEEFRDKGIAVNCLALGSVQTEMFTAAFPEFKAASSPESMAAFIAEFTMHGFQYFNGKIVPVSSSTP